MDSCIQRIFTQLETLGVLDNTIVVINSDHGETLYDHECWFDHHGLYDVTLHVPLIIRYPQKVPAGRRLAGYNRQQNLVPTLLELAGIRTRARFDGGSLMPMVRGEIASYESEFYITECTWMRKHGWRTPQWKLIIALEPDFHFKPKVELYNLVEDPHEDHNLADTHPDVVALLRKRMDAFIARREKETGITNPMLRQGDWHGHKGVGAFKTSQQAYDTLHIGSVDTAKKLQARGADGPGKKYSDRGEHHPKDEKPSDAAQLITIIGRGHSGTRAMSHTLSQSGVYMGDTLNKSGDLLPPEQMLWRPGRVLARHVVLQGPTLKWGLLQAPTRCPFDPEFTRLIESYLCSVSAEPRRGPRAGRFPRRRLVFPLDRPHVPPRPITFTGCAIRATASSAVMSRMTWTTFGVPCDRTGRPCDSAGR